MFIPINYRIKSITCILLPVGIAFYMILPLLKGDYIYPIAEYELYKSFMVNFIETLKNGELPVWNEYVGCGHPTLQFGHYPISQNTIFYMLFGFNDFTYYFTKFLGLAILLLSSIYAFKMFGFNYLLALVGALTYFAVNFVIRILVSETVGNLFFVYPLLMVLTITIVAENRRRDILVFSLGYIFWLSGGHVTYIHMHLVMLSVVYWVTAGVFYKFGIFVPQNLRRLMVLYFILFIVPLLGVMYQYYFVYDVITSSNRFHEGLIVSIFEPVVWKQLLVSFQSSSYFWFGLFSFLIYAVIQVLPSNYGITADRRFQVPPAFLYLVLTGLLVLTVTNVQFSSASNLFVDYLPIINDNIFRIALLLYFAIHIVLHGPRFAFSVCLGDALVFMIYVSLLSHYFFSPENIIGDVKGYDYDLFRELSVPFQILFTLSVLFSVADYKKNKVVTITVLSLIALYLLRSHFTIPLLRFTGIVWYATRDGSIFSVFFAVLFMHGMKDMLLCVSQMFKNRESTAVKYAQYGFLMVVLLLIVHDSWNKFYRGTSHRFVYPNKSELAGLPMEKWVVDGRKEVVALRKELLELDRNTKHFYRLFTPDNHYLFLTGSMQDRKLYEALIYESCISKELNDLFYYTILGKTPSTELKNVMPYFLYTRHVHAGLGLEYKEIRYGYGDFFLFWAKRDSEYVKEKNMEFLFDLIQAKYIVAGPEFSAILEGFTNREHYKLLDKYPKLNLYLYEIVKDKNYTRWAILPVEDQQLYDEVIEKLNSDDVDVLRGLYSKLVFLDGSNANFTFSRNQRSHSTRHYEIFSRQDAVLIDFESWNHNWRLKVNNKGEELHKAFQMFKGIRLGPGLNQIELIYNLKYFKKLFWFSIFVVLIYVILLGRCYYVEEN